MAFTRYLGSMDIWQAVHKIGVQGGIKSPKYPSYMIPSLSLLQKYPYSLDGCYEWMVVKIKKSTLFFAGASPHYRSAHVPRSCYSLN